MLRETALPLSASSVIAAAGSMERPLARRVARHALSYVLLVKAASQGCAVLATFTVQPGRAVEPGDVQRLLEAVPPQARLVERSNGTADAFSDMARSLFPENIVEAFINTDTSEVLSLSNNTNARRSHHRLVAHQAGVLVFCAMLGSVLSSDRGGALLGFFIGLSNAMMLVAHLVLVYAPFGVFFTTAAYFVQARNLQLMASHLGLYLFTVVLALGTHALLVLPLTAMAGTRRSFRALICHGALPLLLSLSMGSGRDTVPATIVALEERLHLDPRIVRLLVPALAVLAVNGTSICVTVSALFFGHMKTDNIEPLTVLYVCLLSELCSMATPTGGGPGYLRLRLIQETVGMPTEYVGILFVTDWIVDRLATVVDVLTGVVGVQVVQHYSGEEPRPREDAEEHLPNDDATKELAR
ncbi:neutral amino acid transporter A-like [Amblyomma americanum]